MAGTADDVGGATAAVDARLAASAATEKIESCAGAANPVIGTSVDCGPALPEACNRISTGASVPELVPSTGFAAFCTSWPVEGFERFATFDSPGAEGAACPAPDIIVVVDNIISSDIVVKGLVKTGVGFGKGPAVEGVLPTAAAPLLGLASDFDPDLGFGFDPDLELRFASRFEEFTPAALFEPAPEVVTQPKLLPFFALDFAPYAESDFA